MKASLHVAALSIHLAVLTTCVPSTLAQESSSNTAGTALTSSAIARSGASGVALGGNLYAFGGSQQDLQATNAAEALNFATDSWTMLAPVPYAVTQAGVEVVDAGIWIAGGSDGETGMALDVVQIYDITLDSWRLGPALPAPRAAGSLALVGRTLHFIGGLLPDGRTDVSEHYVLDVDRPDEGWTAAAPLPGRRSHLSSAVLGGKLYAIGGQRDTRTATTFSRLVHAYDYTTDTWTRVADLMEGRSHIESSTFVYNGRILVAGGLQTGASGDGPTDQILAYDPSKDTWSELGRLPEAVHSFEAGMVSNHLVAAHGHSGTAGSPQSSSFYISLDAEKPDTLGFWPPIQDVDLRSGSSARFEPLLWTSRGVVPFTIDETILPSWLTVTSETSDMVGPTGTKLGARIDASELAPGTYRATIRAATTSLVRADLDVVVTITPESTDLYLENDGLVVAEAENFQFKQAGLLHDWSVNSRYASEGAAVVSLPDRGVNWEMDLAPNGPRLDYRILFATPGTYYVWVRGWGANGNADSWHVGLDGEIAVTSDRMMLLSRRSWPPLWEWSNSTMDGPRATLEIPSAGEHTLGIWMREDGTFIDRILLTTDPELTPSAIGPAESVRINSPVQTSSEAPVGVELPRSIVLEANYPNPFNPSTLIRFSVPDAGHVRLIVSDMLGREAAVLLDRVVSAGMHEVRFDAVDLATGMYYYTLRTAQAVQTRSMVLVR